jgi:hypothetical protein
LDLNNSLEKYEKLLFHRAKPSQASQHRLAAHVTRKQGNHGGGGARPIPVRVGGKVVGEWVEEGLGVVGKRFGAHRVEKLTGVWSSKARARAMGKE